MPIQMLQINMLKYKIIVYYIDNQIYKINEK